MDDRGTLDRRGLGRRREKDVVGVGVDVPGRGDQPAPARALVLVGVPRAQVVAEQPARGERLDERPAGRAVAVQVDAHVRRRPGPGDRLELGRGDEPVDRVHQADERTL